MTAEPWATFERRMNELCDLDGASGLAFWDQQTYCPPKGRETRASVLGTLATIAHERVTDAAFGEAIAALEEHPRDLSAPHRAMLREGKRRREIATKVPQDLVRAYTEQASRTQTAWQAARAANDFAAYRPELEKMFALVRERGAALADGGDAYSALVDLFEPGVDVATLDRVLGALRADLVPFVAEVLDRPTPDTSMLAGPYDRGKQIAFTEQVLREVGFDFEAGRQDQSAHPFCGGAGPDDVRLTTRLYDSLEPGALLSSLHECGHGLYQQGMPRRFRRTFLFEAPSFGVHESQSRLIENRVGRSRAFWQHFLPVAQEFFPEHLANVDLDAFVRAINCVRAGAIRVDADEVTYNLHILLRYELEKGIVAGDIAVVDLPEVWREKMREYLDFVPDSDASGVMQDVHWSEGLVGYFPSYTIGNLYAAMLAETMAETVAVDEQLATGDFTEIVGWLRENIHDRGHLVSAGELVAQVTGQDLSHDAFMRYLRTKFGQLYELSGPDVGAR